MISSAQCRAARGLVGWSQSDLATAAKVGRATIADFEAGKREPYPRTVDDLRGAFEAAGVIFLARGEAPDGGPGVRLKPATQDHPNPVGPATDAVEAMDAAIKRDRKPGKR